MTKIDLMFIAMDCGKHGAELYRDPDVDNMTAMINTACHIVYNRFYGNSSKLMEWEQSFDSVASFHVPGYIGMLQKNIAADGNCLILAGGGGFQDAAKKLHTDVYHKKKPCVFHVQC